jgi:galactokinase
VEFTYQSVRNHFVERFKKEPIIVRSPGRINLIGEHTDYNKGFVMPAAINKEIIFAMAHSDDKLSRVFSLNFNELIEVDLQNPQPISSPAWANYLLGVVRQLVDRNLSVGPFTCVFGGNIPAGSGLSSSAALECGFGYALQQLNSFQLSKPELAGIGQWSEHNFVGVRCGIMDQFANMMGKENHVIQLDCQSMEHQYFPIDLSKHSIVLFNSGVKHSLATSEYNVRRAECEEGVDILKRSNSKIKSLRGASLSELMRARSEFSDVVFNRCKYIIEEIERVQQASNDLQRGDLSSFGKRMFATHAGLSRLYQVSCEELDFLVSEVSEKPEVLGSRMMGGGFGGCTINIVQQEVVDSVIDSLKNSYYERFRMDAETYTVQIKDGTNLVSA